MVDYSEVSRLNTIINGMAYLRYLSLLFCFPALLTVMGERNSTPPRFHFPILLVYCELGYEHVSSSFLKWYKILASLSWWTWEQNLSPLRWSLKIILRRFPVVRVSLWSAFYTWIVLKVPDLSHIHSNITFREGIDLLFKITKLKGKQTIFKSHICHTHYLHCKLILVTVNWTPIQKQTCYPSSTCSSAMKDTPKQHKICASCKIV